MEPCIHDAIGRWYAERDSFAFLPLRAEIKELPPSRPAANECPVDIRIEMFSSHFMRIAKTQTPEWVSGFLVRRKGLEPPTY